MAKKLRICALILVSIITISGCLREGQHGVIVGRFSDNPVFLKGKISLPFSQDPSRHRYELQEGSYKCELSAEIPGGQVGILGGCAGRSGPGEIVCADGKKLSLIWKLTSCQSGFGTSQNSGVAAFAFGFGMDPDQALDQLEVAEK